jgi:hypothetical protein
MLIRRSQIKHIIVIDTVMDTYEVLFLYTEIYI